MDDILDDIEDEANIVVDPRIRYVGIMRGLVCVKLVGILVSIAIESVAIFNKPYPTGSSDLLFSLVSVITLVIIMLLYYNIPQANKEIRLNPSCFDQQTLRVWSVVCFMVLTVLTMSLLGVIITSLFRAGWSSKILIPLFFFLVYAVLFVTDLLYFKRNHDNFS